MKYMFLLLIGAVAFSACTITNTKKLQFNLQAAEKIDGKLHTYWTTTDGESSQFISFGQVEIDRMCKQATASGGVK